MIFALFVVAINREFHSTVLALDSVPVGQHQMTVGSGSAAQQLTVPVAKGKVTLIWVSQLGGRGVHMVKMIS